MSRGGPAGLVGERCGPRFRRCMTIHKGRAVVGRVAFWTATGSDGLDDGTDKAAVAICERRVEPTGNSRRAWYGTDRAARVWSPLRMCARASRRAGSEDLRRRCRRRFRFFQLLRYDTTATTFINTRDACRGRILIRSRVR